MKRDSAAHIVSLTSDASFHLTDRMGKKLSVFNRAVRTYRPSPDLDADDPADHPIAFPETIESWPDGGAKGFRRFLIDGVLRGSVTGKDIYKALPSFVDVHAQVLKQRRSRATKEGASDKQLLELVLEENDSLTRKLKEEVETYAGLLQSADIDLKQIQSERDSARAETRTLQARVMHLEAVFSEGEKQENISIPEDFGGFEEWCAKHLAGSVHVLPRAIRAATKSEFDSPSLAYNALLILRDYFVPMKRLGGKQLKDAYDEQLGLLGLEEQPCFAGSGSGQHGDEYKVMYGGRNRELDRHLKGSNSRDERFGFRLYFLWDDETRQIVVGSLPAHLSTRAS